MSSDLNQEQVVETRTAKSLKDTYKTSRRLNIAMISDFFYPNLGGVEIHITNLAYCLIEKGHKVIGITHHYDDKIGVRYIQNGLKIYYCPFTQLPGNAGGIIFPVIHWPHMLPLLRDIMIREDIHIVHWHQTSSLLGVYLTMNSDLLGLRVIRTNHSLSELEDPFVLQMNMMNSLLVHSNKLDHVISVSHAVRENEVIRSNVPISKTSVIPNAIDCNAFTADPSLRNPVGTINIVYICRITYRKGTDFLIELIPRISKKYLNIHWIIGGDGNKLEELKFLIKKFKLEDRCELLGRLPNSSVCSVLNRGHIFLNTSISEAFCIAALEAASAGLLVVTTNVGGTPEVLPNDLMLLSDPSVDALQKNLEKAISIVKDVSPSELHEKVKKYYSWRNIADRVEVMYFKTLDEPKNKTKFDFEIYLGKKGGFYHLMFIFQHIFSIICLFFLRILRPASSIERALPFPYQSYNTNKEKWGDHSFNLEHNHLKRE